MTCASCTEEVRVKVPSFQNVTLDVINLRFCLFENVTDYCGVRRINTEFEVSVF